MNRALHRNPAVQVLVALLTGLGLGMIVRVPVLDQLIPPVGTIWTNAIRMPILPLIVALVIAGIARGRRPDLAGRITVRALVIFVLLLGVATAIMVPIAPALLSGITIDPTASDALRASIAFDTAAANKLSLTEWFVSLVPTNPIKAAADGAMLPLVLFAMLYGLALTRASEAVRLGQTLFLDGVVEVLSTFIRWVLLLAPIGIFALAYGLGTKVGLPAVAAVSQYIVITVIATTLAALGLFMATILLGRVSAKDLTAALLPGITIAMSSRSSLAALPALIDGVRRHLRLPEQVTNVVLPLAASIFKFSAAPTWLLGALFVGKLYGVTLGSAQIATFALGAVLLSLTTPGIPSGGFLVQAPLYALVGLPVEGLGLLIAVDLIPDAFKTAGNVTGFAAAAVLVGRFEDSSERRGG